MLAVLKGEITFQYKNEIEPCDICQNAKQTREPFPLSDHKTKVLGELVHLVLSGPYNTKSKEGQRYFCTIVDDFTRVVWVYLLKIKHEGV